nr:succinate dehydrogenase [ubiquinone] cytochrome b small subunit, mitochondrial [Quercus suber]POF05258.1 succinate dehydrogenase [ubiquinone] cytochrome b small subunit, mitochondrial [Quercus suber]
MAYREPVRECSGLRGRPVTDGSGQTAGERRLALLYAVDGALGTEPLLQLPSKASGSHCVMGDGLRSGRRDVVELVLLWREKSFKLSTASAGKARGIDDKDYYDDWTRPRRPYRHARSPSLQMLWITNTDTTAMTVQYAKLLARAERPSLTLPYSYAILGVCLEQRASDWLQQTSADKVGIHSPSTTRVSNLISTHIWRQHSTPPTNLPFTMAASLRPTLLRQVLNVSTKRTLTTALPAFRARRAQTPTSALQRAAFQTSSRRAILPPLPQEIKGTVNDAVPVHDAEPSHGSYHWTAERLISAALVPITVAPFAAGSLSPLIDGTFIGLIIIHSYIGFQYVFPHEPEITPTRLFLRRRAEKNGRADEIKSTRSCITDYFPNWRVPTIRKLADWANFLMVFLVGWGFYEFETNDVGLTEGVKRIWKA